MHQKYILLGIINLFKFHRTTNFDHEYNLKFKNGRIRFFEYRNNLKHKIRHSSIHSIIHNTYDINLDNIKFSITSSEAAAGHCLPEISVFKRVNLCKNRKT